MRGEVPIILLKCVFDQILPTAPLVHILNPVYAATIVVGLLCYTGICFFLLNVCFIVTLIKLIEMYKPLTIGFVSSITGIMISHVIILEPAAKVQCVINC